MEEQRSLGIRHMGTSEGTPFYEMDTRSLENLIFMLRTQRLKGLTVKEASLELGVSTRTVFRWMKEGKLRAEKWKLAQGKGYFWLIDPMSVAKILVRKEVEEEVRREMEMERKKKGWKRASG